MLRALGVDKDHHRPASERRDAHPQRVRPHLEASLREDVTAVFERQLDLLVDPGADAQTAMRFRPRPADVVP